MQCMARNGNGVTIVTLCFAIALQPETRFRAQGAIGCPPKVSYAYKTAGL